MSVVNIHNPEPGHLYFEVYAIIGEDGEGGVRDSKEFAADCSHEANEYADVLMRKYRCQCFVYGDNPVPNLNAFAIGDWVSFRHRKLHYCGDVIQRDNRHAEIKTRDGRVFQNIPARDIIRLNQNQRPKRHQRSEFSTTRREREKRRLMGLLKEGSGRMRRKER